MAQMIKNTFSEYRAIDALNASLLKIMQQSPAHMIEKRDHPTPPNPRQALGSAVHTALFEPTDLDLVVTEPGFNKRTKDGKAAFEAWKTSLTDEHIVLNADDRAKVDVIVAKIREHRYASALLEDGTAEITVTFTHKPTGIKCKARIDWLCSGHKAIFDLKTCESATKQSVTRAFANYGYGIQAAFYQMAVEEIMGEQWPFIWCFVETAAPHGIRLFTLNENEMWAFRKQTEALIEQYAQCVKDDYFPGYPEEVVELDLPKWAIYQAQ